MYRFENATRFWMVSVEDAKYPDAATLLVRHGALGAPGDSVRTEYTGTSWDDAYAKAKAELERLIAERKAEGFVDQGIWEDPDGPDHTDGLDDPEPADLDD